MGSVVVGHLIDMLAATYLAFGAYTGEAAVPQLSDASTLTIALRSTAHGNGRFMVSGEQPMLVVVQGLGPSLAGFAQPPWRNVVEDPMLALASADGIRIATNDDWRHDSEAARIPADLRPRHALEAAVLRRLAPGEYAVVLADRSRRSRRSKSGAVTVTRVDAAAWTVPALPGACGSAKGCVPIRFDVSP